MVAVAAAKPKEAMGQDSALEEGVELILDELQQVGTGCSLDLREEGLGTRRHLALVANPQRLGLGPHLHRFVERQCPMRSLIAYVPVARRTAFLRPPSLTALLQQSA